MNWSTSHFGTAEQTLPHAHSNTTYIILSPNIFVIGDVAGGYIKEQTTTTFKLRFETKTISNTSGYMTIGY